MARTPALYNYLKAHPDTAMQRITPNLEAEDLVVHIHNSDDVVNTTPNTLSVTSSDYLPEDPLEF